MTPTKQTVYLPVEGLTIMEFMECKEGYFFSSEQLNEYTANVIKQALETAAKTRRNGFYDSTKDEQSITNTFEETYRLFSVD